MNNTTSLPPAIRAGIHDSAIRRVTRAYDGGLASVFAETLQNARRGGATRVRVSVSGNEDSPAVTVADDGAGIADPAVLLSFGENGWPGGLVRREDAAGMGMLCKALHNMPYAQLEIMLSRTTAMGNKPCAARGYEFVRCT